MPPFSQQKTLEYLRQRYLEASERSAKYAEISDVKSYMIWREVANNARISYEYMKCHPYFFYDERQDD